MYEDENDSDLNDFDYEELRKKVDALLIHLADGELKYMEEEELVEMIDFLIEEEDYKHASILVEMALDQHSSSSDLILCKVDLLIELTHLDEAKELIESPLIDRFDTQYHVLFSEILISEDKYNEAIDFIIEALDICSENLDDLYLQLCDVYEMEEDYRSFLDTIEKAILYNLDNEEAFSRLWLCIELLEEYDRSEAFHQKILDIDPYCVEAWFNLAMAHKGLNKLEQTIEALEFVIAIDSEYEIAYTACGDALFASKEYQKAIDKYLEAEKICKQSLETNINIGECYDCIEEHKKARQYFRKAISQNNLNADTHFRIGKSFMIEGTYVLALDPLIKAYTLDEKNDLICSFLGHCYYENEQLEDALEMHQKSVEISPTNLEYRINCLTLWLEIGDDESILNMINDMYEYFSHNAMFYYFKFLIELKSGNMKESYTTLETALEMDFEMHTFIFEAQPTLIENQTILNIIELYKK
jgi:tetratricopeptide (TPR) repeat protein